LNKQNKTLKIKNSDKNIKQIERSKENKMDKEKNIFH